jgi:hypothetical protein
MIGMGKEQRKKVSEEWEKILKKAKKLVDESSKDPTYEKAMRSHENAISAIGIAARKSAAAERGGVYKDWTSSPVSQIYSGRGKKLYELLHLIVKYFGVENTFDPEDFEKIPAKFLRPYYSNSWRFDSSPDDSVDFERLETRINKLIKLGYLAKRGVLDRYSTIQTEYKVTQEGYDAFEKKISAERMFSIHKIWELPIVLENGYY